MGVLTRGAPGVAFWVAAGVGLNAMGWDGLRSLDLFRMEVNLSMGMAVREGQAMMAGAWKLITITMRGI